MSSFDGLSVDVAELEEALGVEDSGLEEPVERAHSPRAVSTPTRCFSEAGWSQNRDRRQEVEAAFAELFPVTAREPRLRAVVADSLAHPGSLARAHLSLGILDRLGVDAEEAMRLAMAVEYFHTASLLFDDLPAMDDASERRGRPCPHLAYGESATMLGGLAFISRGYELVWSVLHHLPPSRSAAAASLVGECLGLGGILDGQSRDLHFGEIHPSPSAADALSVARGKTVMLIRLAVVLPGLVAGVGSDELAELEELADSWGLAYQILDDFKDHLMTTGESGKTTARDAFLVRPNLVSVGGWHVALQTLGDLLHGAAETLASLLSQRREWSCLLAPQGFLEKELGELRLRLREPVSGVA